MTERGADVSGPSRALRSSLVLGFLVLAIVGVLARTDHVLQPLSDEALLVPLAQRSLDPTVFAGDAWLDLAAQVFSHAYSAVLGGVLRVVPDPSTAVGMLGAVAFVVFGVGLLRLLHEGRSDRAVGAALTWVVVLPTVFDPLVHGIAGGAASWASSDLAALSLTPGHGLPRDLLFALLPWLLLAVLRNEKRSMPVRVFPYVLLGLAANLHPLTAIHFAVVLGLLELGRRPDRAGLSFAVVSAIAFTLPALPYVLQYLDAPRTPGAVDSAVAAWRVFGIHGETPSAWVGRMELPGLAALLALGLAGAPTEGEVELRERTWRRLGLVVLTVAAAAPLIAWVAEPLRAFQLQRLGRVAFVLLGLGVAPSLVRRATWTTSRFRVAVGAVAAYALLSLGLAVAPGPASPAHRAARVLERARDIVVFPPAPQGLVQREVARKPSSDPELARSFRAVAAATREQVPPGEVVLVPPDTFGAFRGYAWRPTSVTKKEGGFAVTFLGGVGNDWFEEYAAAVAVYASGSDEEWEALAERYRARFVVVEAGVPVPAGWRELSADAHYRLLAR